MRVYSQQPCCALLRARPLLLALLIRRLRVCRGAAARRRAATARRLPCAARRWPPPTAPAPLLRPSAPRASPPGATSPKGATPPPPPTQRAARRAQPPWQRTARRGRHPPAPARQAAPACEAQISENGAPMARLNARAAAGAHRVAGASTPMPPTPRAAHSASSSSSQAPRRPSTHTASKSDCGRAEGLASAAEQPGARILAAMRGQCAHDARCGDAHLRHGAQLQHGLRGGKRQLGLSRVCPSRRALRVAAAPGSRRRTWWRGRPPGRARSTP